MVPTNAIICNQPSPGILAQASRPLGMSVNSRFMDGEMYPGHLKYSGTMKPMQASMDTRPCWSSMTRRRLNAHAATAGSSNLLSPSGSQKPTGGQAPNSFEKSGAAAARSGESV